MRNILLLISIIYTSVIFGQNSYDNRLNEVYTSDYIQTLDQNHIKALEFELDNSYFIIDNFEKNESLPELYKRNPQTKEIIEEPLTNEDLINFNVLNYSYEKKYNSRTFYKIGNTGKTIVFYSIKEFTESYNLTK